MKQLRLDLTFHLFVFLLIRDGGQGSSNKSLWLQDSRTHGNQQNSSQRAFVEPSPRNFSSLRIHNQLKQNRNDL